jgi:hypothetical protein
MDTTTALQPTFAIQRASERALADRGWLKTYHSFSFADYFDPANLNWGTLRVFNDDTIAGGTGFGTHPHRDMEILTYVLSGELEHKDSMGNVGVVGPGGVQYLSAGTGIAHSEYNHLPETPVRLVQMWVLPRAHGLKPQYGQIDFAPAERTGRWLPIASGLPEVPSRITIFADAACYVARLAGERITHRLDAGRFGFLFVAAGNARANDTPLAEGDAVRIAGPLDLSVEGTAELVLWDVPALAAARAGK